MVFRYNEASGVQSLDPAFSRNQASNWINAQLYSTLVRSDSSLVLHGDLAKDWAISDDGLQLQFSLRQDVRFHNDTCFAGGQGRAVTAYDVAFSLNRLMAPATGSSGAWVMAPVAQIQVLDVDSLILHLKRPDPTMMGRLSMPYCGILPKEAVDYYGLALSEHPVGSGPFYLKAWRRGDKMVLRRHAQYHEIDEQGHSLPYLESVAIRFIPDRQAAFLECVKGNLDFISGLDPSYKDQLLDADGQLQEQWSDRFTLRKAAFLNTEYLAINMAMLSPSYLGDQRLRQTLNLSLDRHRMIRYLKNGLGQPGNKGFIPIGMPGHRTTAQSWSYDLDSAKVLLEAALGDRLDTLAPILLSTTASYRDLCEYVQSAWTQLGLTVKVEVLPSATFREAKAEGRLAMYRASWIADYADPQNYMMLFDSRQWGPKGPNAAHVNDPLLDTYLDQAAGMQGQERLAVFEAMDARIQSQALIIPLIYDESLRLLDKSWIGLPPHPMNALDLRRVRQVSP